MKHKDIKDEEESKRLKSIRRQKKKTPRMKVSGSSVRELQKIMKKKSKKK
ncbi:hypothetical protein KKB10_02325 [Patescibacteria group bacterium]|nr:hypothetical protein [Patescibacteria group bacterium]MBU1075404.1 hypothetical protein [Patescibacteria group bacterium]MBU1952515.1 hypothetical protein [Patescibacteria group bacterium]MBU2229099.1 hypothetical protein [Patescibacteria group bacterium]MBU2235787.1 hypothetical protein [Patescibacteria group bacterium]